MKSFQFSLNAVLLLAGLGACGPLLETSPSTLRGSTHAVQSWGCSKQLQNSSAAETYYLKFTDQELVTLKRTKSLVPNAQSNAALEVSRESISYQANDIISITDPGSQKRVLMHVRLSTNSITLESDESGNKVSCPEGEKSLIILNKTKTSLDI
jgi:hypothetical protein